MLGTEDIASRHSPYCYSTFFGIKTENEASDNDKLLKMQKWNVTRKREVTSLERVPDMEQQVLGPPECPGQGQASP